MSDLPFRPSCPAGGNFYVCSGSSSKSRFIGCCIVDPCNSANGCAAGNLRAASYDANAHESFADQECSAGRFYTCNTTSPPFLGCCKDNPCARGSCPQSELAPIFLSNDPTRAAFFLSAKDKAAISSTGSPASTSQAQGSNNHHGLSKGGVIGLSVGAVVVILVLVGALMFICGKRAKEKKLARRGTFDAVPQQDPNLASPSMQSARFSPTVQKAGYSPYADSSTFPSPQPYGTETGFSSPRTTYMSDHRYSGLTASGDYGQSRSLSPAFELSGETKGGDTSPSVTKPEMAQIGPIAEMSAEPISTEYYSRPTR